jgi:hypothetical protein
MVRHVQKPEPLPQVKQSAQVFGRKNQLLGAAYWLTRVDGQEAARIGADYRTQQEREDDPTHETSSLIETDKR